MRDIYNPPPAPMALEPPPPEPLKITRVDVAWLVGPFVVLLVATVAAWRADRALGLWVIVGGTFVVLESWFSGLSFLRRHPAERALKRWLIFLAAMVPWLVGVGLAMLLMLLFFWIADWRGG